MQLLWYFVVHKRFLIYRSLVKLVCIPHSIATYLQNLTKCVIYFRAFIWIQRKCIICCVIWCIFMYNIRVIIVWLTCHKLFKINLMIKTAFCLKQFFLFPKFEKHKYAWTFSTILTALLNTKWEWQKKCLFVEQPTRMSSPIQKKVRWKKHLCQLLTQNLNFFHNFFFFVQLLFLFNSNYQFNPRQSEKYVIIINWFK